MHDAAPITYGVTFTAKVTGLKVDVIAQVNCGDGIACPTFTYDWDWADATAHGTANPDTHTYASYAAKKIVLTVRLDGKVAGSATRSVTPAPPTATFAATITGLKVDVLASADCGGSCPTFTYDWNWGDRTAHGSANPGTHTYAVAGTKTVTLTLSEGGKILAMTAKNVRPTSAVPDLPPTASATCTWDANTWTATVVDTSTDTDTSPVQTVTVDWGDLSSRAVGGPAATLVHTYIAPPKSPATSYTLTLTAIDSALKASTPLTLTCTPSAVAPAYFAISGTVYAKNGTTPLPSASVTVKKGTSAIKTAYTAAGGTFSAGSLKPGTYTLTVTKAGYTFAAPAATITVGPNSTVNNIVATGP
jgi:PKD repeat protein